MRHYLNLYHQFKHLNFVFLFLLNFATLGINPNDIDAAKEALQQEQVEVIKVLKTGEFDFKTGNRALALGLWNESEVFFKQKENPIHQLLFAKLHMLRHAYPKAEALLKKVTTEDKSLLREKTLLHIQLNIQAWQLAQATIQCNALLQTNPKDIEAGFWLGRIAIFEKNYDAAAQWGQTLQKWDASNTLGYGLEAEAQLWKREIDLAGVLLKQALTHDAFHPDFRFWYGYTIWRKRDASLLNQMAAQWEFALTINPLHYLTHWHWGNGHTNLTYADYVDDSDTDAADALTKLSVQIQHGQQSQAMAKAFDIQSKYPNSAFPPMFRASYFYNFSESQATALDSAQTIFSQLLMAKAHYGPAHNGIAAVIKKKQFRYLTAFDSLEREIEDVQIPAKWQKVFYEVFPDLKTYPTARVPKMVWSQLHSGKAYLPMLKELEREFVIPPLHVDLATAMKNPFFRSASTFDNRQWMDIRGVGSGATGIEYVERGSHLERNVTLHEFVHLFHYTVLTDEESRKVRALYFKAKKEDRTLDYYAANNEAEYFAQCFTAFFSLKKVHPLNHKSMNTRQDLKQLDPEMFAFLEEMTTKHQQFLDGDESALAQNWAQTYVLLAKQQDRPKKIASTKLSKERLYEKALSFDPNYLPAHLGLVKVWGNQAKYKKAEQKLESLIAKHPDYAPIYLAMADLEETKGKSVSTQALGRYTFNTIPHLKKAYDVETDLQLKSDVYFKLRAAYLNTCQLDSAIAISKQYWEQAPEISTYLHDAKHNALAFKNWQAGKLGHLQELESLKKLITKYPQNYQFWTWQAEVFAANDQYEQLVNTLLPEAQRLAKTGNDYANELFIQVAEAQLYLHKKEKAQEIIDQLELELKKLSIDRLLQLIRVQAYLDRKEEVEKLTKHININNLYNQAAYAFTNGKVAQFQNNTNLAMNYYIQALELNPYHIEARSSLIRLLMLAKEVKKARKVVQQAQKLNYPLGDAMLKSLEQLAK